MSAIEAYLSNNLDLARAGVRESPPAAPSRHLAIVACMDSRLELGSLLGLEEGEAHVIRNAGGVVTNDVLRSLTISQRLLGTREVMVIQHTDCGMLSFSDQELSDAIEAETSVRPPFEMLAFENLEGEVRRSISRIEDCPFLPHRNAVRGFVYDVDTRLLKEIH